MVAHPPECFVSHDADLLGASHVEPAFPHEPFEGVLPQGSRQHDVPDACFFGSGSLQVGFGGDGDSQQDAFDVVLLLYLGGGSHMVDVTLHFDGGQGGGQGLGYGGDLRHFEGQGDGRVE